MDGWAQITVTVVVVEQNSLKDEKQQQQQRQSYKMSEVYKKTAECILK